MPALRCKRILLAGALLGAAMACGPTERARLGADLERELEQAREYAATLVVHGRSATEVQPEAAIALGYLERLRLGLGSPFRLIDYALHDPRLVDSVRTRLAWALLARTFDGEMYAVPPAALDGFGATGHLSRGASGRDHLELIEGAITEASGPRGGELAVRLAYTLAAAEGSVGERTPVLAARVAALIRDRELARNDALRLLRAAEAAAVSPLTLLPEWRADRRFVVEQPSIVPVPLEAERQAVELAPRMVRALRSLGHGLASRVAAPLLERSGPLLGQEAARRLAAIAEVFAMPPQTPVVIAADIHRGELLGTSRLGAAERAARRRFLTHATNEERLAAEYALLEQRPGEIPLAAAKTMLAAAVGLRPYAQEEVWFPGFGGPSARELENRFGLTAVEFDPDVPAAWRPYYRRMLARSLTDLRRVLPTLSLDGLRVEFGEGRSREATLALHDPTQRRIYLPPATAAGTIAHEVAHDLDWQVALRRYRVRGDYGTDRATRIEHDRLAAALRELTTSSLVPPQPGDPGRPTHSQRPAEVFARSVDWFVVVSLAREGLMNGYLSSVQDDLLTGYGTVAPPDVTGRAGRALTKILDEVAPVYAVTRRWFLENYGPNRMMSAYDLVRTVLEAPIPATRPAVLAETLAAADPAARTPRSPAPPLGDKRLENEGARPATAGIALRFAAVADARSAAFSAIDAWVCHAPAAAYDPGLEAARRRLVAFAAGARARGIALEHADALAGERGRRWLARHFYGAPWPSAPIDSVAMELLAAAAERVARIGDAQIHVPEGFHVATTPGYCAASPLLRMAD